MEMICVWCELPTIEEFECPACGAGPLHGDCIDEHTCDDFEGGDEDED